MDINEAIRQRIEELKTKHNLATYSLALKAEIPPSTLKQFMNGSIVSIKVGHLLNICFAFEISLSDFFDCPYIKNIQRDD